MNPEWSDFKVLLALAHGGSVAGAARELGVDGSILFSRLLPQLRITQPMAIAYK